MSKQLADLLLKEQLITQADFNAAEEALQKAEGSSSQISAATEFDPRK